MKLAFFDTKPYDIPSFEEHKPQGMSIKFFETKLNEDTVDLAKGFDAVCAFVNDRIDATVIDRLQEMGIRVLALRCAGFNNVDMKYAHGRLHVLRVPAYSPYAVAEHAMALLLTSIRRIHKAYIRSRDFNFSLSGLTGFDLYGKTVGIIGTGRIGQVFAHICRGFGMQVLAYDKFPNLEWAKENKVRYTSLEELLKESDILSLHCPLNEETHHLINAEALEKCKKGVVILNTSRGALIDAEALLNSIKERKVGAACLDVYEEEADLFFEDNSGHILEDDILARLISMPNVIVTSHQAFLTREALDNIAETTISNLLTFFETGSCPNELCYRGGTTEDCKNGKCF